MNRCFSVSNENFNALRTLYVLNKLFRLSQVKPKKQMELKLESYGKWVWLGAV